MTITGREQTEVSRELILRETFGVEDKLNLAVIALRELYQIYATLNTRALEGITALLVNFKVTF